MARERAGRETRKLIGEKESISVKQAGARGGRATLEKHGREFLRRIAKKGGQRTAQLYAELLSEFGRKGGRPKRPSLEESLGEKGQ